jgi:hypothetical protein
MIVSDCGGQGRLQFIPGEYDLASLLPPVSARKFVRLQDRYDALNSIHKLERLESGFATLVPHACNHSPLLAVDGMHLIAQFSHTFENMLGLLRRRVRFHDYDHGGSVPE